jgi:hypothetical protein
MHLKGLGLRTRSLFYAPYTVRVEEPRPSTGVSCVHMTFSERGSLRLWAALLFCVRVRAEEPRPRVGVFCTGNAYHPPRGLGASRPSPFSFGAVTCRRSVDCFVLCPSRFDSGLRLTDFLVVTVDKGLQIVASDENDSFLTVR